MKRLAMGYFAFEVGGDAAGEEWERGAALGCGSEACGECGGVRGTGEDDAGLGAHLATAEGEGAEETLGELLATLR